MFPLVLTAGKSRPTEFKDVAHLICGPVELINSFVQWKVAQSSGAAVSYYATAGVWISGSVVGFLLITLMKHGNATLSRKWSERKLICNAGWCILFHCSCCRVGVALSLFITKRLR